MEIPVVQGAVTIGLVVRCQHGSGRHDGRPGARPDGDVKGAVFGEHTARPGLRVGHAAVWRTVCRIDERRENERVSLFWTVGEPANRARDPGVGNRQDPAAACTRIVGQDGYCHVFDRQLLDGAALVVDGAGRHVLGSCELTGRENDLTGGVGRPEQYLGVVTSDGHDGGHGHPRAGRGVQDRDVDRAGAGAHVQFEPAIGVQIRNPQALVGQLRAHTAAVRHLRADPQGALVIDGESTGAVAPQDDQAEAVLIGHHGIDGPIAIEVGRHEGPGPQGQRQRRAWISGRSR